MEDDDDPSSDFEPLFIREENGDPETDWSTLDFPTTHTSQPSSMGPYLLEMDDLLKRCEELTAIPLESDPEQMLGERETSPYFSTSHTGNTMGMADECAEHQFHEDMPITSSGNKLSSTMVQYEGQLMGMLAMLESCMDEAPVDFEMNQEYVHVNKVKDVTSERQSVGQRDPSRNRCESEVHDQEFKYSKPSMTVGCTSRVDDVNIADSPKESLEMEMSFVVDGFQTLASQMEKCIEELQRLERKRKDLLAEVLELRRQEAQEEEEEEEEEEAASEANISNRVNELMAVLRKEEEDRREERKREVQLLRSEVAEEERRVWKAEMEKQELRDEMRKLKRQLFTKAKESAHIQAALNKRRHEMDLRKREEEKLQTLLQKMTEEGSQLKSQHQQYLRDLRAKSSVCTASRTCNTTQEELSRRNSCGDIQQYLQDGLRALENRYEPVLLGLQKRKETTTRGSLKAKEQTRELKAQLGPLREEMQAQVLQRARLQEKLKLVHVQRREDAEHYEESIRCLERSSRELKMELTVQRRKNKEAEDLRDCLSKQILLYRSAAGDHQKSEHQKEA